MAAELEARVQALDGSWEVLGVDRYRGVVPEGFSATSDDWGFATCSFILRRPTDQFHPDLSAFTPCEIFVAGTRVWEGRIRETPTQEGPDSQVSVAGVGWQAQLDDDQIERMYVQSDLTAWADSRSFLTANLASLRAAAQVNSDQGGIGLVAPQGSVWTTFNSVAVTIDLGPDPLCWARRIVATMTPQNLDVGWTLALRGADQEGVATSGTTFEDVYSVANPSAGTVAGTFTTARRYISFLLFRNGATVTTTADVGVKIVAASLFSDTSYEAANASTLRASQIVPDVLNRACPLLSTDYSLIDTTAFNINDFTLDGPKTAREIIQAANAFHRWVTKVISGARFKFSAQPNAPLVKVGDWPGAHFQDASSGSGEEIYNRCLVTGTKPNGAPLRVSRLSGSFNANSTAQPSNPRADVDASGWSSANADATAPTRDTSTFNSTPASFKTTLTNSYITAVRSGAVQGVTAGRRYRVSVALLGGTVLNTDRVTAVLRWLDASGNVLAQQVDRPWDYLQEISHSVWGTYVWEWQAPAGARGYQVELYVNIFTAPSAALNWDDVQVLAADGTLVDRRGFIRTKQLPISSSLDDPAGAQVGDVYLSTHAKTPLKGALAVDGPGGVRRVHGDEPVHPSELLLMTTELIRMANHVDPDTGALGRDGIIASVTYTHDTESAVVQIDNDRNSLDALLARLAVVTGARGT